MNQCCTRQDVWCVTKWQAAFTGIFVLGLLVVLWPFVSLADWEWRLSFFGPLFIPLSLSLVLYAICPEPARRPTPVWV
jgi:hypothetical protein